MPRGVQNGFKRVFKEVGAAQTGYRLSAIGYQLAPVPREARLPLEGFTGR
jgi:hypothetical protein